jgi:hypothetical protein
MAAIALRTRLASSHATKVKNAMKLLIQGTRACCRVAGEIGFGVLAFVAPICAFLLYVRGRCIARVRATAQEREREREIQ